MDRANRQQQVSERVHYQITAVERHEAAIADLVATLSLARVCYRCAPGAIVSGERLKGAPLSIAPLCVKQEDQVTGLTHLLSVALRVLTLADFVVRRSLQQQGAPLAGLCQDNRRRAPATPTAERLRHACVQSTLTQVQLPDQTIRHVTTFAPVQEQILRSLVFPAGLYAGLAREIPQTAFPLRE